MKNASAIPFTLENLKIASIEDATFATGATLFYFPNGALAQADIRGGSAATSETSLLEGGAMSCVIDGVVFAGGSTMGLAASDGVRSKLYEMRGDKRTHFDKIPSVPGAVVYDYGTRIFPGQDPYVYPNSEMGRKLFDNLSDSTFYSGRAGAGISTTANKISGKKIWGGQGLAQSSVATGSVVCAVINNPYGNIDIEGITPIDAQAVSGPVALKQNTTLSIVMTDLKLDRDQLKRLAIVVHTSMARRIFPFQTFSDGDCLFAISLGNKGLDPKNEFSQFVELSTVASETMLKAIENGVLSANGKR